MTTRLLTVVLMGLFSVFVGAQTPKVVGAYMHCEMACQAVQIRSDGTFQRLLDGDLYNDERTNGMWWAIGRNRIKALSTKPGGPPKVTETRTDRQAFKVVVTDSAGGVLPGAEISGSASGTKFICKTENNGECEIPIAQGFDIKWDYYTGSYLVRDPSSRIFHVELSYEQTKHDFIDDVWVIEGGRLFFERDGKIERDYSLKRVSRIKEKKLFPKSKS